MLFWNASGLSHFATLQGGPRVLFLARIQPFSPYLVISEAKSPNPPPSAQLLTHYAEFCKNLLRASWLGLPHLCNLVLCNQVLVACFYYWLSIPSSAASVHALVELQYMVQLPLVGCLFQYSCPALLAMSSVIPNDRHFPSLKELKASETSDHLLVIPIYFPPNPVVFLRRLMPYEL